MLFLQKLTWLPHLLLYSAPTSPQRCRPPLVSLHSLCHHLTITGSRGFGLSSSSAGCFPGGTEFWEGSVAGEGLQSSAGISQALSPRQLGGPQAFLTPSPMRLKLLCPLLERDVLDPG